MKDYIQSEYNKISSNMAANKLILNDSKTHLVVLCNKADKGNRDFVSLKAGPHTIKPTASQRLLGAEIAQDLKWKEHTDK